MRLWEIRLSDQSVMLVEVDPLRNLKQEFLHARGKYFAPTEEMCVMRAVIISVEPFDPRSVKSIVAKHSPLDEKRRTKKLIGF